MITDLQTVNVNSFVPSGSFHPLSRLIASKYSGLLMNSRYFNHSVLIMTCILAGVCVRNIPASWRRGPRLGRASVSWLRDKSAQSQTNQTIFQFIFHIYIKSTQNKQKTFQIWVFPCCTESPECCGRGKMKIWIPHQTQCLGLGFMRFHDKSNFVCLCPMHGFFPVKLHF